MRTNDGVSLEEVKHLLRSGIVHNVVISPGPGNPSITRDIGALS